MGTGIKPQGFPHCHSERSEESFRSGTVRFLPAVEMTEEGTGHVTDALLQRLVPKLADMGISTILPDVQF